MSAHEHPRAVGGKLLDPTMKVLLVLFGISTIVMAYRFYAGVGAVSNMTDGFTWGIVIVIRLSTRGTVDSDNWYFPLAERPVGRSYHL